MTFWTPEPVNPGPPPQSFETALDPFGLTATFGVVQEFERVRPRFLAAALRAFRPFRPLSIRLTEHEFSWGTRSFRASEVVSATAEDDPRVVRFNVLLASMETLTARIGGATFQEVSWLAHQVNSLASTARFVASEARMKEAAAKANLEAAQHKLHDDIARR